MKNRQKEKNKDASREKIKKLERLRDEIERNEISLDKKIKHLNESSKIYKELRESLFKKKPKVMIVKEEEGGNFSLNQFEGDE